MTPFERDGTGCDSSSSAAKQPAAASEALPVGWARMSRRTIGGVAIALTAVAALGLWFVRVGAPGPTFRDCDECPVMVVLPTGSYMMGSPTSEGDRREAEGPQHRVTIGYPLAVGVYEVTFDEWDACAADGGCHEYRPDDEGWGRGSRPVINVSRDEVRDYLAWLGRRTGQRYRLLSESEWEWAARGGTTTARYWGESESDQCVYANGYDRTAYAEVPFEWDPVGCSDGYVRTAPVGTFGSNGYGLHDVLGNVWEWTADCWHDSYSDAPTDGSAWGSCSVGVLRGGSWSINPGNIRSASRIEATDWYRYYYAGFRVARTVK